ncbi:hypothetical protein DIPPA_24438 [Diplonema papillatum]|nr:hypothetical protein DIPPA_24438 [Diplonema papillatum]
MTCSSLRLPSAVAGAPPAADSSEAGGPLVEFEFVAGSLLLPLLLLQLVQSVCRAAVTAQKPLEAHQASA